MKEQYEKLETGDLVMITDESSRYVGAILKVNFHAERTGYVSVMDNEHGLTGVHRDSVVKIGHLEYGDNKENSQINGMNDMREDQCERQRKECYCKCECNCNSNSENSTIDTGKNIMVNQQVRVTEPKNCHYGDIMFVKDISFDLGILWAQSLSTKKHNMISILDVTPFYDLEGFPYANNEDYDDDEGEDDDNHPQPKVIVMPDMSVEPYTDDLLLRLMAGDDSDFVVIADDGHPLEPVVDIAFEL